jgi:fructokinase
MRIGIDMGGTKIECLFLGDEGEELFRKRVPTPKHDYEATLLAVKDLVDECEAAGAKRAPVGVGHPGAVSPATGLIKNANSIWLNGRPLAQDLERVLHRPLRLANDANCFALSEATDGAAAGARVVFGVIIGTGTGGGVVVDGRVLTGPNAIAGEWGHNPLPWPTDDERPGPPCYCGRSGCIESFLSGPGMVSDYEQSRRAEQESASGSDGWPPQASGAGAAGAAPRSTIDAAAIVALAGGGDPHAQAVLGRYVERMARSLATVINLLDPDVIVLGGGLSNIEGLYTEVPHRWPQWIFSDRVDTRLVRARHGDSSGVRGAAWLWPRG